MPVHFGSIIIRLISQFNIRHFFQPQHFPTRQRTNHKIAELFGRREPPTVFHRILKRIIMVLAKSSRSRFNVLFRQYCRNISRNQFILSHFIRFHPDTHTIIRSKLHYLPHSGNTLDTRFHINLHIVIKELKVVRIVRTIERKCLQLRILLFHRCHANLGHFGRQQAQSRRHTVLYIYRRHIRITALLEEDIKKYISAIGSCGRDIIHILHSIDSFLQRNNHTFLHCFRIRSRIVGKHLYRRRSNIGILLYR